ncbi:MAG TPA: PQQ-dependent sugar dehydrogenase [Bryobacteraceae bacterium]|nr:PQQ-dependent sugar dehydrogenase [Bryobacteraceae bacterium]
MTQRGTLLTVVCLLLAASALFYAADQSKLPVLPPPYATPAASNQPRVIPRPAGAELTVPPGFHVEIWAEDFSTPRYLMYGPSGEILLADSGSSQRPTGIIYVLQGKDQRKKIIENLNRPYGLAMLNGYLYVGECDSVKRYKYDSKAMTAGSGEEVVSLKGQGTHHWTRSLLFDKDGKYLYVGVGSGSNSSPGEDPRRAAIVRYKVNGWSQELFATGLRNPIGIHWYPGTDTLWAAIQERDDLGDDLVPDYLTHVQQGGFYGWPFAYIGPHEDPTNKGLAPDLVKKAIVPDELLGAHVAVLDFVFYTGKQFPAEYQGGAFLAWHGSWNRSKRVGQSIAFVPFQDAKPAGPPREVLSGWMLGPDKREVWGRPVAILQMTDGSLLISDDGGKRLWHMTYTGK